MISAVWLRYLNLVAFNGFWYMLLLIAGGILPQQLAWLVLLYCVIHLLVTPYGWCERAVALGALGIGYGAEFLGQKFQVVAYSTPAFWQGVPLWVGMMWMNFAVSLAHSWWPWLRPWWSGLLVGALALLFPYWGAHQAGILKLLHPWPLAVFWLLYGLGLSQAVGWLHRHPAQGR